MHIVFLWIPDTEPLLQSLLCPHNMISDHHCPRQLPATKKAYLRYSALVKDRLVWAHGFRRLSPCSLGPVDFEPVVRLYIVMEVCDERDCSLHHHLERKKTKRGGAGLSVAASKACLQRSGFLLPGLVA